MRGSLKRMRDGCAVPYSESAVRNNLAILEYSRIAQAALTGCVAGILGLSALFGFLFYLLATGFQSFLWLMKTRGSWSEYFMAKSSVAHGVVGHIGSYLLFWTFLYGVVHVY